MSEINLNAKLILSPCPINWTGDEVPIENDDDDLNRENLNNNQDEQDEGWGDREIELPPGLVCFYSNI
ncbi:unnamed protein product [Rotaria sp. Silwood1]|nr:unnamed protein product [Rotaria sp. Silwood1]